MADVITLSLALRPVRIEIDDDELAAELRANSEGFVLANEIEPWLTIRATRCRNERAELKNVVVHKVDDGRFCFVGPRSRGIYGRTRKYEALGEVTNITALHQFVYFCLSMSLPCEGGLLLHADTVEWLEGAVSFLGRSGSGKSTAAEYMIHRGAKRLAVDRTVIFAQDEGRSAFVVTLPSFGRKPSYMGKPWSIPLSGIFFPSRGRGVNIIPLGRLETCSRLLQNVVIPEGEGLPVDEALTIAQHVANTIMSAELSYEAGRDFTAQLDAVRIQP